MLGSGNVPHAYCALQPDFGELEAEMKAMRERRSVVEDAKRAEMRAQWEARKAKEEEARQAELEVS